MGTLPKSLEELAAEHVLLTKQGAYKGQSTVLYYRAREIYTEMIERFLFEEIEDALKNARQAYDILVPKPPTTNIQWMIGIALRNPRNALNDQCP